MRLIQMKCSNCGAPLDINLDHLQAYCPYCGQKLLIDIDKLNEIIAEKEKTKRTQMTVDRDVKIEEIKNKGEQIKSESKTAESKYALYMIIAGILFFIIASILIQFIM